MTGSSIRSGTNRRITKKSIFEAAYSTYWMKEQNKKRETSISATLDKYQKWLNIKNWKEFRDKVINHS